MNITSKVLLKQKPVTNPMIGTKILIETLIISLNRIYPSIIPPPIKLQPMYRLKSPDSAVLYSITVRMNVANMTEVMFIVISLCF